MTSVITISDEKKTIYNFLNILIEEKTNNLIVW